MTFIYEIENNGVKVKLECQCDYDYCTEEGASAYLTHAVLGDWNLAGLMTKDEREEIEEWFLENWYELDQRATHQGIREAKLRGDVYETE